MLIWLEVGLCLMFALAVGATGFRFLECTCFCLPVFGSFPKNSSLDKVCTLQLFQCYLLLLYWSPVGVVVGCVGGKVIYNLMIKSQSFSGPVSLGFDFHKCFFALFFPP